MPTDSKKHKEKIIHCIKHLDAVLHNNENRLDTNKVGFLETELYKDDTYKKTFQVNAILRRCFRSIHAASMINLLLLMMLSMDKLHERNLIEYERKAGERKKMRNLQQGHIH